MKRRISFGISLRPKRAGWADADHMRRIRAMQEPLRGENNGAAKLTDELVRKIRRLHAEGERPCILARRFEIERTTLWHVLTRRTWGHV